MRFSVDFDKEIFKFLSYSLIVIAITMTIGFISFVFLENELGKLKINNINKPYLNQISESLEI